MSRRFRQASQMSGNLVYQGQALIWGMWTLAAIIRGTATEVPERNTKLGWVRGKQTTVLGSSVSVNVFLGIPFAAPPVGPLRFANPQPAKPWNDTRDATSYPPLCFQTLEWISSYQSMLKVRYPKFRISEDCLYLNIYVPAHADDGSKLPVMVWIPGGGFQTGSASIYDGSALAAYEDVLVVIIQYRLGIFGFFVTPDRHCPGNWALKDQLAALSWVQENIKFFGGNPNSVTISGGSAGAVSASGLILSPLGKGLFHRAIMESGVAIIPYLKTTHEQLIEDLEMIAQICGCSETDSEALLKCLRAKSSDELMSLNQVDIIDIPTHQVREQGTKKFNFLVQKTMSFTRAVDGDFFPHDPLKLLSQKTFEVVPSLIGVNNQECGFMLPMEGHPEILSGVNRSVALGLLHTFLNIPNQYLDAVANEYFQDKTSVTDIRDALLDLFGDVFFVVPALVTARFHRDSGAPVYFYEFQHRPQCFEDSRPAFVKADHTDEIRFVFGGAFLKGDIVMFEGATEKEKLLSKKMMNYWANFARSGNPNGGDLPHWPAYNATEQYLMLDLDMGLGQELKKERVKFWISTLPYSMSASETLLTPHSSLIFFSLTLPFFLLCF